MALIDVDIQAIEAGSQGLSAKKRAHGGCQRPIEPSYDLQASNLIEIFKHLFNQGNVKVEELPDGFLGVLQFHFYHHNSSSFWIYQKSVRLTPVLPPANPVANPRARGVAGGIAALKLLVNLGFVFEACLATASQEGILPHKRRRNGGELRQ